jgi:hypothetical protein
VKFLEHLSKQYADSSCPEEEDLIEAPDLSVKSSDTEGLEKKKNYYINRIQTEVSRLQASNDSTCQKKVTALKLLQETIRRQQNNFDIEDIVVDWKNKGNWHIINMHRSTTSGMLNMFSHTIGAGKQLTETACFIEELAHSEMAKTVSPRPKLQSQLKK